VTVRYLCPESVEYKYGGVIILRGITGEISKLCNPRIGNLLTRLYHSQQLVTRRRTFKGRHNPINDNCLLALASSQCLVNSTMLKVCMFMLKHRKYVKTLVVTIGW